MKVPVRSEPVRLAGFRFAGAHCGLKESGARDVAVICSDVPATAAAAFTTNRVQAAPVLVGLERAAAGRLQAVVVNSGNANAYTGDDGLEAARRMCVITGRALGIDPQLVLPSSTGRIGVPLPLPRVERGIRAACKQLTADGFHQALEGMMTTDAFPKFTSETIQIDGRHVTVVGMAKGAGMIAPRMALGPTTGAKPAAHATMLAYILTDAVVSLGGLRRVLRLGLPESFNAAVVDGDTSTNDTVVLMANGLAGHAILTPSARGFPLFAQAVLRAMTRLARLIVKDGEGATKVIDIVVQGARNVREAERVADTIARSPLCKAAFFGSDPYAGRVVCAAGYSGAVFDPGQLDVYLDDVQIVSRGRENVAKIERRAAAITRREEFTLTLNLHAGTAQAHRMASDLTIDYVRFNSAYRT